MSPARAAQEILRTFIAMAGEPRAPATCFGLHRAVFTLNDIEDDAERLAAFRWFKSLDRAIGLLCAEELGARAADPLELERCLDAIRCAPWPMSAVSTFSMRLVAKLRHRLVRRLSGEWEFERERGPGLLTRVLLASTLFGATHRLGASVRGALLGDIGPIGQSPLQAPEADKERHLHAEELIQLGIATGRERKAGRAFAKAAPVPVQLPSSVR